MGSKKSQTTGYRYYMGLHFGLCHGPVDELQQISVGDRVAWAGTVTSNASVSINAPELMGGDKKEGGIVGGLDVEMGGAGQGQNSYLASAIGAALPAFRGILSAVWKGGQVSANNPYIKPWSFRVKRIKQGWSTGAAWYSDKASVMTTGFVERTIVHDTAIPGNSAGGSPSGGLVISGLDPSEVITLRKIGAGASFSAWSGWATDNSTTPTPPPVVGKTWTCAFNVTNAEGVTTQFLSYETLGFYETAAAAAAAADGFSTQITGSNSYTIWLPDPNPPDNRGGLSLSVTAGRPVISMNPAHIVYECLTNSAWGMGYPTTSIDEASFTAAADTLHSEGFGLCMLWNKQDTLDSFIKVVMDHAGGILYVDPSSGNFALKLLRNDYDRDTLPQFGPSSLVSATDYQRQAWGETVNEVTVVFRDAMSGKDSSVTVQDLANIQTQGAVVSQIRQYPGLPTASLAQRVAMRDLNASSTPLARVKLTATRAAWSLIPGDVFRLTWPDFDVSDVVFRVLEVNRGTLQSGAITIDAVEDVFGLPSNTYVANQPGGWSDPASDPQAATYRKVAETPYWDLARSLSPADLDYLDPLSGYVETLAARPSGDSINYEINTRTGAAEYAERAVGEFCPTATLSAAIGKTATAIAFGDSIDVDLVKVGGYGVIGDEYFAVTAIDADAGTATIARGVLDTVPADHAAGARIWFADGYQGADQTEYASGEVIDVKLLPRTGVGELALAFAPADAITMARRHNRPYPPGLFRISGQAYPVDLIDVALSASWAHRDRLSQTAYLVQQSEASIGPEAGTSYTVRLYDVDTNTLIASQSGIAGTSWTGPVLEGAYTLRLEVEAVRGALTSWQAQKHQFTYINDVRLTEDGDMRETETAEIRTQE